MRADGFTWNFSGVGYRRWSMKRAKDFTWQSIFSSAFCWPWKRLNWMIGVSPKWYDWPNPIFRKTRDYGWKWWRDSHYRVIWVGKELPAAIAFHPKKYLATLDWFTRMRTSSLALAWGSQRLDLPQRTLSWNQKQWTNPGPSQCPICPLRTVVHLFLEKLWTRFPRRLVRDSDFSRKNLPGDILGSLLVWWVFFVYLAPLGAYLFPTTKQILSLGDVGFLLFFRVVSGDYGKPCNLRCVFSSGFPWMVAVDGLVYVIHRAASPGNREKSGNCKWMLKISGFNNNNNNSTKACLLMFGLEKLQEVKDAILLLHFSGSLMSGFLFQGHATYVTVHVCL